MTVTLASAGTPTVAAGSASAPAPTFPATVNAGQKATLKVNLKPFNATCATPAGGWTLVSNSTNGSVAGGANVGSTAGYVFEKICDGTEDGATVTLAITNSNSSGAQISTYDTSLGGWATTVVAWGNKVGNSANISMTSTTQTSVAAGDLVEEFFSINSSAGTPSTDTFSQTGVTPGTVTNRADRAITTGNDSRIRVNTVPITSVTTPSGGSTGGYTNASSTSGLYGAIRLRDASGASNVTGTASLTGVGALVGSGKRSTFGSAAVATSGALVATGKRTTFGSATLAGAGSLVASGARKLLGAAALSGVGSLVAVGAKVVRGVAALVGGGAVTASGLTPRGHVVAPLGRLSTVAPAVHASTAGTNRRTAKVQAAVRSSIASPTERT